MKKNEWSEALRELEIITDKIVKGEFTAEDLQRLSYLHKLLAENQ